MKYAKPAISMYPVVKKSWQPTPATKRLLGPTISKAEKQRCSQYYNVGRWAWQALGIIVNVLLNLTLRFNGTDNDLPMT